MSLQYALLGLLHYSPMAGYDLKKIFDTSINFFWAAHTSQIYRELKDLEKSGFVVSEVQPGEKGPDKKVYRITDEGQSHFKLWLADFPEPTSPDTRDEFLVRVFFASEIGLDSLRFEMQRKLKEYKKDKDRLAQVDGRLESFARYAKNEGETHFWKICLSRGVHSADANIAWAEETLEYLSRLEKERQHD